jgi:hypothetical protein
VRKVYPRVVPDLYADRPLVVHGRYARGGDGDVTVRGRILGRAWQRTIHVSLPAQSAHDATPSVLPSLWALTFMNVRLIVLSQKISVDSC